jgi:hypothetical protein
MAIKYNPLDPFGTKSLFDDINKTNQQINSMNLPMQPTQPKQDFKKQRYGNMMLALSDVLRGQNPSAGVMQRQALIDAEQKEAERKAAFKDIINNSNLIPDSMKGLAEVYPEPIIKSILSRSGTDKTTFERFGIYDNKGTLVDTVNKGDIDKINKTEANPNLFIGQLRSKTLEQSGNQKMELFSVTDGDGNRIQTIADPTKEDIDDLNKSGYLLNRLPTPTDRGKGFDSGKPVEIKGWNDDDGLKSRYFATNTLVNTGERLLKQLSENPNSVLTVGDFAQAYKRIEAELGAVSSRPENYTEHLKKSQRDKISDLANNAAVSESMLLDFTFQIAAARGQTGRGLSDKDFIIFQKIIAAGTTAEQKASALTSFIDGIASEVQSAMQSNYDFYNTRLNRDPEDKEAITFVQGIDDLRTMPFKTVTNPFVQTTPSTATNSTNGNDPLGIR